MSALSSKLLLELTAPASRLPGLEVWLRDEIWSDEAFTRARRSPKDFLLAGERLVNERESETLPKDAPGLWMDESRRLAVLAGRGHNRPQAPSASQSVYRHGGLTLMEMLTPWLVLGPVGSA